jgi:hypothetical protein
MKRKTLKIHSKLDHPWPSNSLGTRRRMKMECEFTNNIEAGEGPVPSLDPEE